MMDAATREAAEVLGVTYFPSAGWRPLLTGAHAEKAHDVLEGARLAGLPVRLVDEPTGEVIPETALPAYEAWQDEQISERVLIEAERPRRRTSRSYRLSAALETTYTNSPTCPR
jgi:hypothetical protein